MTRLTAGGLLALLEGAWRAVPAIEELPIAETWVGFRPGSRDDAPMLGPSGIDGLVIATGHHRNGILLTPVTAAAISAYILTGRLPRHARCRSRPERFAAATARPMGGGDPACRRGGAMTRLQHQRHRGRGRGGDDRRAARRAAASIPRRGFSPSPSTAPSCAAPEWPAQPLGAGDDGRDRPPVLRAADVSRRDREYAMTDPLDRSPAPRCRRGCSSAPPAIRTSR